MKILAYKGISLVSRLIRWQTRSEYSHIGVLLSDNSVVEAWHIGGVQRNPHYRTIHTPGTEVDVFRVDYPAFDQELAEEIALTLVGLEYDFKSVFRFLTRRDAPSNDMIFCAELAMMLCPFLLERINPSHVSPMMVTLSPFLKLERTVIC